MSDDQHRLVEPLLLPAKPGGRPRTTDPRRSLDGLSYGVRTGRQRRRPPPPPASPPWPTVHGHFRASLAAGVRESVRHHLVATMREREGREPSPTAAIIDTRSVRTTEKGGPRGGACPRAGRGPDPGDAAKRVEGRERHIAADSSSGFLLGILVHAADIQDADAAGELLRRIERLHCRLRAVFADGVHDRLPVLLACFLLACFLLGLTLIVARRVAGVTGLVLVPWRRVAERTLGRLGQRRRLARDCEELPEVSEAAAKLAMIRLMPQRLAHPRRRQLPLR